MTNFKDDLIDILEGWTIEELDHYIEQLEERIEGTRTLIAHVRRIRKTKQRKKTPLDTGSRGGK